MKQVALRRQRVEGGMVSFRIGGSRKQGYIIKNNHHTALVKVDFGCIYINDANRVIIKRHKSKHRISHKWDLPWL